MATGDSQDIIGRLKALIPPTWYGDNSPIRDAILTACASALAWCYSLYLYAKLQTRIGTATDGWLDIAAYDYFGTIITRSAGQSDDLFRNTIKINLFRERGTRQSVISILEDLTGKTPVVFEPQRPMDTGAYGAYEPVLFTTQPNIFILNWAGISFQYTTARSNLITYSEQLNNSSWMKSNGAVTSDITTAPDGNSTAELYVPTTTNTTHPIYKSYVPDINTTYTFSVFLKAAGYNFATISIVQASNLIQQNLVVIDLSAGLIVSATDTASCTISPMQNGWWRISVTSTTASVISGTGDIRPAVYPMATSATTTFAGNGVSGIYIWGGQLETSSISTSYIPTTSSIVTVTDYSISDGNILFFSAPNSVNQLLWSGSGMGSNSGNPINGNLSQFGIGDSVTTMFQINGGTASGSNLAYGLGGGYGSQKIPYQAFITAYRPDGTGIPYVAGYSSTPAGYGIAYRGEYASQTMLAGSITDDQIYAAIASVKMEGTIAWVKIADSATVTTPVSA